MTRVFALTDENPDGWLVRHTLTLGDDATFSYGEAWSSYGGSAEWSVSGTYDVAGDVVTLHVLETSRDVGAFAKGKSVSATLVDGVVVLDGFRLEPRGS